MEDDRVEWVEIVESKTKEYIYANLTTGQCVWELPEGAKVKKADDNQWWELRDPQSSKYYYYNTSTQKTVWLKPQNCDIIPLAKLQTIKQNTEVVDGLCESQPQNESGIRDKASEATANHVATATSASTRRLEDDAKFAARTTIINSNSTSDTCNTKQATTSKGVVPLKVSKSQAPPRKTKLSSVSSNCYAKSHSLLPETLSGNKVEHSKSISIHSPSLGVVKSSLERTMTTIASASAVRNQHSNKPTRYNLAPYTDGNNGMTSSTICATTLGPFTTTNNTSTPTTAPKNFGRRNSQHNFGRGNADSSANNVFPSSAAYDINKVTASKKFSSVRGMVLPKCTTPSLLATRPDLVPPMENKSPEDVPGDKQGNENLVSFTASQSFPVSEASPLDQSSNMMSSQSQQFKKHVFQNRLSEGQSPYQYRTLNLGVVVKRRQHLTLPTSSDSSDHIVSSNITTSSIPKIKPSSSNDACWPRDGRTSKNLRTSGSFNSLFEIQELQQYDHQANHYEEPSTTKSDTPFSLALSNSHHFSAGGKNTYPQGEESICNSVSTTSPDLQNSHHRYSPHVSERCEVSFGDAEARVFDGSLCTHPLSVNEDVPYRQAHAKSRSDAQNRAVTSKWVDMGMDQRHTPLFKESKTKLILDAMPSSERRRAQLGNRQAGSLLPQPTSTCANKIGVSNSSISSRPIPTSKNNISHDIGPQTQGLKLVLLQDGPGEPSILRVHAAQSTQRASDNTSKEHGKVHTSIATNTIQLPNALSTNSSFNMSPSVITRSQSQVARVRLPSFPQRLEDLQGTDTIPHNMKTISHQGINNINYLPDGDSIKTTDIIQKPNLAQMVDLPSLKPAERPNMAHHLAPIMTSFEPVSTILSNVAILATVASSSLSRCHQHYTSNYNCNPSCLNYGDLPLSPHNRLLCPGGSHQPMGLTASHLPSAFSIHALPSNGNNAQNVNTCPTSNVINYIDSSDNASLESCPRLKDPPSSPIPTSHGHNDPGMAAPRPRYPKLGATILTRMSSIGPRGTGPPPPYSHCMLSPTDTNRRQQTCVTKEEANYHTTLSAHRDERSVTSYPLSNAFHQKRSLSIDMSSQQPLSLATDPTSPHSNCNSSGQDNHADNFISGFSKLGRDGIFCGDDVAQCNASDMTRNITDSSGFDCSYGGDRNSILSSSGRSLSSPLSHERSPYERSSLSSLGCKWNSSDALSPPFNFYPHNIPCDNSIKDATRYRTYGSWNSHDTPNINSTPHISTDQNNGPNANHYGKAKTGRNDYIHAKENVLQNASSVSSIKDGLKEPKALYIREEYSESNGSHPSSKERYPAYHKSWFDKKRNTSRPLSLLVSSNTTENIQSSNRDPKRDSKLTIVPPGNRDLPWDEIQHLAQLSSPLFGPTPSRADPYNAAPRLHHQPPPLSLQYDRYYHHNHHIDPHSRRFAPQHPTQHQGVGMRVSVPYQQPYLDPDAPNLHSPSLLQQDAAPLMLHRGDLPQRFQRYYWHAHSGDDDYLATAPPTNASFYGWNTTGSGQRFYGPFYEDDDDGGGNCGVRCSPLFSGTDSLEESMNTNSTNTNNYVTTTHPNIIYGGSFNESPSNTSHKIPTRTSNHSLVTSSDRPKFNINRHKKGLFRKKLSIANMLSWSKEPIQEAMIETEDKVTKREAIEIFKKIQMYMGDKRLRKLSPSAVALEIVNRGLDDLSFNTKRDRDDFSLPIPNGSLQMSGESGMVAAFSPCLRDEIYMQLCRQTTENPRCSSLKRGWELLAICLTYFSPSPAFRSYLETYCYQHLDPIFDPGPEAPVHRYAGFCLTQLQRRIQESTVIVDTATNGQSHSGQIVMVANRRKKPLSLDEIERAKICIFKPSMFGNTLEEVMMIQASKQPSLKIPWIQSLLSKEVLRLNGPQVEGIFRVPGDIDEVNILKGKIDQWIIPPNIQDPHVPASLLKLWYRELYEPLIPAAFYQDCINYHSDPSKAVEIVDQLPEINRYVLCYLIKFLQIFALPENSGVSKMDANNLAMVMAPNCLRCQSEQPQVIFDNARKEMAFIRNLIQNLDTSFVEVIFP